MDYNRLQTELTTDPLDWGYAGMSDQQAADRLNLVSPAGDPLRRTQPRPEVPMREILHAITSAELQVLTGATTGVNLSKFKYLQLLATLNDVDPGNQHIRDGFAFIVAAGASRDRLLALSVESVSRGQELNLGETVLPGHVQEARARPPQ